MSTHSLNKEPGKKERLKEELIKYGLISGYLYVCFSVLIVYKIAILKGEGITLVPYGVAIVQALVLGKFILIGDALSVGTLDAKNPLLHRIAWKTVAMIILLVVFKAIEEIIVGLFHHVSLAKVWADFAEKSPIETLAPIAMMGLVIAPLIAVAEIARVVGVDRLRAGLMGRGDA